MSSTVISQCSITLHDVITQVTERSVSKLIKKILPNVRISKINLGDTFYKNGKELYHIYVILNRPENVDELMKQRSKLRLYGEPLRITRSLPKFHPLYNKSVTGLKIKIHQSVGNHATTIKLNESDLRRHFKNYGIRYCKWTNADQTEALFAFADYDFVDQIILFNPSPEIKGIKVDLEKTWTDEDYITYERPYVIHVTNLPLRVTSEEISTHFEVPIAVILLYPCFRLEQSHIVGGRSSSEAWIKNFSDEKTAQILAEKKRGTFIRTNKIRCEAMLEPIGKQDQELCDRFQIGQCPFPMDTCHFKHYSCSEPDTCDDENCWFGHTNKRTTVSIDRIEYRSEDARYRVKFSNLPSNITHEGLMARLNIHRKYSHLLILQPTEENPDSPKMAYLIRQPWENKLRRQIDQWHNTSFSPLITRKIQCQLEINQDFFDWSDSTDITRSLHNSRCPSPVLSTHSARSDRTNQTPWISSAASTSSCRPSLSKTPHTVGQSQLVRPVPTYPSIVPKNKPTTNTLKSKSVSGIRQAPSDFSRQWRWTNQMILYDQFDQDELYWVEAESNKEKNVVTKIYVPKNDRTARIRARREQVALNQLTSKVDLSCVPTLLDSNVDTSNNDQPNKDLWTIMKLFNGERLSDYIKGNKPDLREALHITRRLLNMIKQIHDQHVIHRDIQPKNILIEQRSNTNELNLMLINFSSAWTHSIEDINEQLGNSFYRMPQFENRSIDIEQNEAHQQLKQFQCSPTIDTTGICAILFWLITGHEPKESQDIWGQPPHKLRENPKVIERKINEVTAFRMEMKTHEHVQRHLMHIFDRSFAGPEQQWSVDELDYQFQFIISLIEGERDETNYFPPPQNTNNQLSSLSIPLEDPFVYIVTLIHHLKHQFAARYRQCVRWSTEEKNRWSSQDGRIEHFDLLIFRYQTKNLSINIHWNVKILRDKHFSIDIKAKINDKIDIEVPMGIWKINEQTNQFDLHFNNFEMEIKILINIICQSIEF